MYPVHPAKDAPVSSSPGPEPGPDPAGDPGSHHGHRLGPHLIGQRVVVRRLLPGQTGPSGGPAFADTLGIMESWADGITGVRTAAGDLARIRVIDIVSGKPIPPRPSVRHRVSAEEAERRALASWPARETAPLGEWVLRASDGYTSRANSVLAVGDPWTDFTSAVASVISFYTARSLPPWAQVVVDSDLERAFSSAGWVLARPGEADTLFQIASVAAVLRSVRELLPPVVPEVRVGATADPGWLADDERSLSAGATALAVLEGPQEVGFASVLGTDGEVVAKGRAARGDGHSGSEDWMGITNVWVSPDQRRRGLATVVMRALLDWGAERGATTAYLQTRGENTPALALYERLGFLTHHAYRYLTPGT